MRHKPETKIEIYRIDVALSLTPEEMTEMAQAAMRQYVQRVQLEMLRVLGFTLLQAEQILKGDSDLTVQRGLNRLLMHYAVEYFNTFEFTPVPRVTWQLSEFWEGALDTVAPGLRTKLTQCLADGNPTAAAQDKPVMRAVLARNKHHASTRPQLFRENLRHAIQDAVQGLHSAGRLNQAGLDAFIQAHVQANTLPQGVV